MKQGNSLKQKIKGYLTEMYHSHRNKLTNGAAQIVRMLKSAHGNQWRKPKSPKK